MQTKNYAYATIIILLISVLILVGYSQKKSQVGPCDSETEFFEAVESNNFDNCMNIQESYCQDYCRFKIAAYSDTQDNCEKIQDLEHKDLCYYYLSLSLKDVSLCNNIERNNGISKSVCETLFYKEYGYPTTK